MDVAIHVLDRRELPGFRPYLLPETIAALERQDPDVLALGAVTGRSSCGAVSARLSRDGMAELTDLFVDGAARRQGVGGRLLDDLQRRLEETSVDGLSADYVLREEELVAMDRLLSSRGFYSAGVRSRVFAAQSSRFHDDKRLGPCFSRKYLTAPGMFPLSEVPEEALAELEEAEDLPDNLSWSRLRGRFSPDLSVALLREGRAEAYLLAGESGDGGCVLMAAVSRTDAPPTAFLSLLKELLNRFYYWRGGDFSFYFSVLTPRVERLARALLKDRYTDYEEHVWYWLPLKPTAEASET